MTDLEFQEWLADSNSYRVTIVEVEVNIDGVETTLYLSDKGFTDDLNGRAYLPVLLSGLGISENLNLDSTATVAAGDIRLDNTEGDLDPWLGYVWRNRKIKAYIGEPTWPRADWIMVLDGVVRDLNPNDMTSLQLVLMNKLDRLNKPALSVLVGGTGPNKDNVAPAAFGQPHNITPVSTNATTLEFQFSVGPSEDVIEVRDNGAPRTDVVKDLANGKFRLTDAIVGSVTASVQGRKPGGVYTNRIGPIIQDLVKNFGPVADRFVDADLDLVQLAEFDAAFPQPVALYVNGNESVLSLAQELAATVRAQVVCTSTGKLRLIPIRLPVSGTPRVVTMRDMVDQTLVMSGRTEVRGTNILHYCKNWTVQNTGMARGLPASSADLFAKEWLIEKRTDSMVTELYRLDTEPDPEESHFTLTADAAAECEARKEFWKSPHAVYTAEYFADMLTVQLGDPITIFYDRFGLNEGKTGMVFSVSRDYIGGRCTVGVLI